MEKLFIGIDISKDKFDYCILSSKHEILSKGFESNTVEGIDIFHEQLKKYPGLDPCICMECTGHYGYLLVCEFSHRKLRFSLLNPLDLKKSMGLVRGKNDAVDAYRIASYALRHQHTLTQSGFPLEALRKLKATVSAREGLKKESVKLQNRIKALKIVAQTTNISTVLKVLETQLGYVKEGIKELESELKAIIKTSEELGKTYDLITSVLGVGLITASNIIVESENFTKITNPRKFACHSGIAPFPYSSGSSVRGASRTSHFCKKSLKGVLFKAAATAIQHDPQLKAYYERKVAEGKHNLCALNAVANKIVLRIFAVQKKGTPYILNAA
jgi:transposase